MAIIITIMVVLLIMCYVSLKLHESDFGYKTDEKILVFSHKDDIDRYGLRYFTKAGIQKY